MKSRVILVNSVEEWDTLKRYKINDVVSVSGIIYQNTTGVNSNPSSLTDWILVEPIQMFIDGSSIGNLSTLPLYAPHIVLGGTGGLIGAMLYFADDSWYFFKNDGTVLIKQIKSTDWYERNVDENTEFAITKQAQGTPTEDITRYEPLKSGPYAVINIADEYSNDTLAAAGGIKVGECYHHNGTVKIRLT